MQHIFTTMLIKVTLLMILLGVEGQRYRQPVEFTELMGQCEDMMCGLNSTCEYRNASCLGRPCQRLTCVPAITKEGRCPAPVPPSIRLDCDGLAEFLPSCYEDNHCTGTQRCCPGRCFFKECQEVLITSTSPPTPPPVLILSKNGRPTSQLLDRALTNSLFAKRGICPKPNKWFPGLCKLLSVRNQPCQSDSDCSGDRKCCPGRCEYKECGMPDFPNTTVVSPPTPRVFSTKAPPTIRFGTKVTINGPPTQSPRIPPFATNFIVRTTTTAVPTTSQPPPPTTTARTILPAIVITQPVPKKPGSCPAQSQNWKPLCGLLRGIITSCNSDSSCPEVQKCCPGRCELSECKAPILTGLIDAIIGRKTPALGVSPSYSNIPRVFPSRSTLAKCPRVPGATSPANTQEVDIMDKIYCSLLYMNMPVCSKHADCTAQQMCCRTRCKDFRCQDPIYS